MKKKKILITVLCVVLGVGLIAAAGITSNILVNNYMEKKRIESIPDNFTYDCVLVVYKKEKSEINKVHTADEFKGVDVESIKDLSYVEDPENNQLINREDFHQIISIHLKEKTKENVVKTVEKLRENEDFEAVEYNYVNISSAAYSNVSMTNVIFVISSNGLATASISINADDYGDDIVELQTNTKLQKRFWIFWLTIDNGQENNKWTEKSVDGYINATYEYQLSTPGEYRIKTIITSKGSDGEKEKIKEIAKDKYIEY